MRIIEDLLQQTNDLDHPVKRVAIGLCWTVVESRGIGLSHTYLSGPRVEIAGSGRLSGMKARELARRALSPNPLEASLGLAALNSLLNVEYPDFPMEEMNVGAWVKKQAPGKVISVVGRFPFIDAITGQARKVYKLELEPEGDELPAAASEEVLPLSDITLITATTLINHTADRLLELGAKGTNILLGPSTPLHPAVFAHPIHLAGGIRVTGADALFRTVMEGARGFNQLRGVRPVVGIKA